MKNIISDSERDSHIIKVNIYLKENISPIAKYIASDSFGMSVIIVYYSVGEYHYNILLNGIHLIPSFSGVVIDYSIIPKKIIKDGYNDAYLLYESKDDILIMNGHLANKNKHGFVFEIDYTENNFNLLEKL